MARHCHWLYCNFLTPIRMHKLRSANHNFLGVNTKKEILVGSLNSKSFYPLSISLALYCFEISWHIWWICLWLSFLNYFNFTLPLYHSLSFSLSLSLSLPCLSLNPCLFSPLYMYIFSNFFWVLSSSMIFIKIFFLT